MISSTFFLFSPSVERTATPLLSARDPPGIKNMIHSPHQVSWGIALPHLSSPYDVRHAIMIKDGFVDKIGVVSVHANIGVVGIRLACVACDSSQ